MIGSVPFTAIFLISAVTFITTWDKNCEKLTRYAIPEELAAICLGIATGLCILGSLSLLFGVFQWIGYILLLVFMVPVTIVMHVIPFYYLRSKMDAPNLSAESKSQIELKYQIELVHILKNAAMIGALLTFLEYEFRHAMARRLMHQQSHGQKSKPKRE